MVFSTNLGKTSCTKVFIGGKTSHGHSFYINLRSQLDSTLLLFISFLITNNIWIFQKSNLSFIIFLKLATKKNKIEIIEKNTCAFFLLSSQTSGNLTARSLFLLIIFLRKQNGQIQEGFHGCYAIVFMVYNEAPPTSCAHGQDFKRGCIIVTNYTLHNLALRKVNMLIIIYFKECTCD